MLVHGRKVGEPARTRFRNSPNGFTPANASRPWQNIFVEDEERRHSFAEAVTEYNVLLEAFIEFGYKVCEVPRMANQDRVEFILSEIGN
jgi:predicted ATPase